MFGLVEHFIFQLEKVTACLKRLNLLTGAEVIISHNGSLPLQSILTLLQKHMKTLVAENVQGYAAKMSDGMYHVYFTSSSELGNYKAASKSFKAKFEKGN